MTRLGYVVATSTPYEFTATLDPERPVGLYEYVALEHSEFVEGDWANVRLLGQIVKIYRDPYSGKRDLPLYSVMSEVAQNVLEVQLAKVKVLGYILDDELRQPKFPPRIGAPVYLADDTEVAELFRMDRGLCVGRLVSRNIEVCLDINGIRRHMAVIAATGSGKTWFSVVLLEELLKKGGKVVVIDPHGEYVPIKDGVAKLGPYDVTVLKVSPHHAGDLMYRIGVLDSDPESLANAAGVPPNAKKIRYALYLAWAYARRVRKNYGKPVGLKFMKRVLLATLRGGGELNKFLQSYRINAFPEDELRNLQRERHAVFSALTYLKRLERLGIFGSSSTPLGKILGDVTIVNLAGVNEEVQDFVVWHLVERIFRARVRAVRGLKGVKIPWPVVLFVEEAHRFAPPKHVRRTKSHEALTRVAAEGRKFGVYLVVITQRPSRVDPDVISQCQSQVIMRVINPLDQEAIRASSELLGQDLLENLPGLDTGEAVVLGPVTPLPVVIKVRDRVLDYGGGDIDLAAAWSGQRAADVLQIWKRLYNSPPPPSVLLAAARLKVVERINEGGRLVVRLEEDGRHVDVVFRENGPVCTVCGGRPCHHVYKALEVTLEVI